jgi:hypothetical protein
VGAVFPAIYRPMQAVDCTGLRFLAIRPDDRYSVKPYQPVASNISPSAVIYGPPFACASWETTLRLRSSSFDTVPAATAKSKGPYQKTWAVACRANTYKRLVPKNLGGTPEWIRTTDLLLRSYTHSFLSFLLLLGFSTTWGICFRLADIL